MPVSPSSQERESPSAESEVFQEQFEILFEGIQSKLRRACEEFLSKDFIDDSLCGELVDDSHPRNERAKRLLCTVERRIREDSNHFDVFLEILKILELSDLASQLNSNLKEYVSKYKLLVDNHLVLVGVFESRISEVPGELIVKELIDVNKKAKLRCEMSPVDMAIVLADGVLETIKKDISKFTILMDYLSESFELALNWPTQESSPGTFFTFLSDTVKIMKSDILSKGSKLQEMIPERNRKSDIGDTGAREIEDAYIVDGEDTDV